MRANNRKKIRRQVSEWPARVIADLFEPMRCVILNVSESGARIQLAEANELPSDFRLVFGAEAPARNCLLIWQNDCVAGVAFNDRREKTKKR